jgi:[ribosomal protein S5]-alanine N-acetyltransferase
MTYPPRIETARLYTRALTQDDAHAWAGFLADAEATRYLPNPEGYAPLERAEVWIARQLGRYAEHSYGMTALMHRETGAFIGQCGLLTQTVDDVTELEIGYHIFPQYWRQGYASEAAQAFRDLAFENALSESVISLIHPENLGSQGVARHNGMALEKIGRFRDMHVRVYRVWRGAWLHLKSQ